MLTTGVFSGFRVKGFSSMAQYYAGVHAQDGVSGQQ